MTSPYYLPMGTTVRLTRENGWTGNVGRIFGRCNGSQLYNVEIETPTYYGKSTHRATLNLYPCEFEVVA